jgi:hypothetical protein
VERAAIVLVGVLAAGALLHGARLGAAEPPEEPEAPVLSPAARRSPRVSIADAQRPAPPAEGELPWAVLETYDYAPGLAGLPAAVAALDGKRVTMRGFLMALTEWDDIHEFTLVKSHMSCCFGMIPGFSGQVLVKIKTVRGLPHTNEPIEVTGTFRVAEVKEEGFLLAIFSIVDAEARIVGY